MTRNETYQWDRLPLLVTHFPELDGNSDIVHFKPRGEEIQKDVSLCLGCVRGKRQVRSPQGLLLQFYFCPPYQ